MIVQFFFCLEAKKSERKNMLNRIFIISLLMVSFCSFYCNGNNSQVMSKDSGSMSAQKSVKVSENNTICPITGEPVDKEVFTVYKGKTYYFCCKHCIKTFLMDPEKYIIQ